MSEGKELVNWKEKLAASAKEVAKAERPSLSNISLKAGVMTYAGQAIPGNSLDCVVLVAGYERTFYDRPYDPDDISAPTCFAQSGISEAALAPHENVPEPRAASCAACPFSKFGSAINGKGQACKIRRKLALLPASSVSDPDTVKNAELAILGVPPTSTKFWGNYANKVAGTYGRPPWAVVTTIKVTPNAKTQFQVDFQPKQVVDDEGVLAALHDRLDHAMESALQPYSYDQEDDSPDPAPETAPKKGRKY